MAASSIIPRLGCTDYPLSLSDHLSLRLGRRQMGVDCAAKVPESMSLVFTYGTLKRGFSNYNQMESLMEEGDASFVGNHVTEERYPLVCGPYRVPFLLDMPGAEGAANVTGEVYAVSARGMEKLDELEGTKRGHYERGSIKVRPCSSSGTLGTPVEAEAYFGHRSYAGKMWIRTGKSGYSTYGEKESSGYVRRKDRPQGITFLEHINSFLYCSSSN